MIFNIKKNFVIDKIIYNIKILCNINYLIIIDYLSNSNIIKVKFFLIIQFLQQMSILKTLLSAIYCYIVFDKNYIYIYIL